MLKIAKAAKSGTKTVKIGIVTAHIRHSAFVACLCLLSVGNVAAAEDLSAFPKWLSVIERQKITDIDILRQKHGHLVSRYRYIEDQADYWKTPAEFRRDGGGDCEDFAIALYFDAVAAGVREDKLQITIGWLDDLGQVHAALRYEDFYFDNRTGQPFRAEDYERVFRPIYEINRMRWKRY